MTDNLKFEERSLLIGDPLINKAGEYNSLSVVVGIDKDTIKVMNLKEGSNSTFNIETGKYSVAPEVLTFEELSNKYRRFLISDSPHEFKAIERMWGFDRYIEEE